MNAYIFLIIAVGANLATNFSFKRVARTLDTSSIANAVSSMIFYHWTWLGIISGCVLLASFVASIRHLPLSVAYPTLTAAVIISLTVAEAAFDQTPLTAIKVIGICFAVVGISLLTLTTGQSNA